MSGPKRSGTSGACAASLAALWLAFAPPCEAGEAGPERGSTYPRTIQKVWYRTGTERGLTGAKHSGDLMVTRDSLEFLSRKADRSIPFAAVRMISFGTMRGDVDTEWAVLSVEREGAVELVGFRDGRKMGYGQRTREIYEAVLGAAEELGWAQFRAPAGMTAYTALDHVFAWAVPDGWTSYHHDMVGVDGVVVWGTTVFVPSGAVDVPTGGAAAGGDARAEALRAIQRGASTAWIARRVEAARGMACDGFGEGAAAALLGWVAADPFLGVPFEDVERAAVEPTSLAGCTGLRLVLRARDEAGAELVAEVRAVARRGRALVFGLRTTAEAYPRELPLFERGAATLRFAVAD